MSARSPASPAVERTGAVDVSVGGDLERQREPEGAALTELALDTELAAHGGDELLADREAQTGPTEPTGSGGVGLGERFEQTLPVGVLQAHTGVGDLEPHHGTIGGLALQVGTDDHLARAG